MGRRKKTALLLIAVMLVAALAGCGGSGADGGSGGADADAGSDTLRFSLRMDLASLNPLNMQLESENMVAISMFMPLFYYAVNADEARSDACESWEASDDARQYSFLLKEGITFHNGEALTIEDVAYSVSAAATAPAQSVWAINYDKVEVTGEREVTVYLKEPDANFLRTANIFLLHEKTMEELGDAFETGPVGCGPYKFVSFEPGYKLALEAFDDYIGGAPDFGKAEYTITTDASAAVIALENGETDAIASTAYVQYESLKANEKIDVTLIESAVDLFIMNTKSAPFDDVRVRQAINYAVDKERASEAYTEGLSPPATSLIPWLDDPSLTGYPYDIDKAKSLLAEAGFPDGKGFPPVKVQTIDAYKTYAQVIQDCLVGIGIDAEVELGEATSLTESLLAGQVPFSVFGISLGFNTAQYNQILVTDQPYNLAFYSNPKVDALFADANKELDTEKSRQLYIDILKIVQDDAAYGLLADTVIMYAYNNAYDFQTAFDNFSSSGIRLQDIKKK
ncbi:MAG: ABC transporter substrate-binding protein [Clostridiales Family XIII bacterium]|jgi:peptide/nickel transport system substrate-binding protein|nr:ABC transporter substrate-binding protein [Clostridiales Family XIII bacterium]